MSNFLMGIVTWCLMGCVSGGMCGHDCDGMVLTECESVLWWNSVSPFFSFIDEVVILIDLGLVRCFRVEGVVLYCLEDVFKMGCRPSSFSSSQTFLSSVNPSSYTLSL